MAENREWTEDTNTRGYDFTCCKGEHVSLSELKLDPDIDNRYLQKNNIPPYPNPLVFYVPKVCHVTEEQGLRGIFADGGFNTSYNQDDSFLWWSLEVTEADIVEAEENYLEDLLSDGQAWDQQPFLKHFTTSPAFESDSRYGNFRFTFPLKELLYQYARQFCYNSAPVLRVLNTTIYKKEIVYSVLVHPRYINYYNQYPRLPRHDDNVCGYFQGNMSWSCQAPSGTHGHRLMVKEYEVYVRKLRGEEYYVWDHVAIAFHMEPNWILQMDLRRLFSSVSACDVTERNLLRDKNNILTRDEAEETLEELAAEYGLD